MKLNDAIQEFQMHLDVARSPATARTYNVALTHLATYATINDIGEIKDVHPGHFLAYLKEGRSPVTLASYMTALSQFAEYAHSERLLRNGDYVAFKRRLGRLRGRSPQRKLPPVPSEDTFLAVLNQAKAAQGRTHRQELTCLRNIALLETLRSTGCRVSEVINLRRNDLSDGRAMVTGKGDKMRVVFFDDQAWSAVMAYLDLRGDTNPHNQVFARHDRRAKGVMPLSTTSVRNVIDKLATEAGLDPASISPHKWRHRFATTILGATGNLAGVQDLLGHASPTTTRIYARLSTDRLGGLHDTVQL